MAKTSGKNRAVKKTGGFRPRDYLYKGKIENVRGLATIKHNDVYRDIKQGIARFEAELGVRERNVKLAEMEYNINGVQMTSLGGENAGIYLNSKVYDMTKAEIIARTTNAYKRQWATKTNKPIQHTVTHELAHALWNTYHSAPKSIAAGKEIKKLYDGWRAKPWRKGYGEYSHTNMNEFWAEVISKSVHGNADKWTRKAKWIVKKFNL